MAGPKSPAQTCKRVCVCVCACACPRVVGNRAWTRQHGQDQIRAGSSCGTWVTLLCSRGQRGSAPPLAHLGARAQAAQTRWVPGPCPCRRGHFLARPLHPRLLPGVCALCAHLPGPFPQVVHLPWWDVRRRLWNSCRCRLSLPGGPRPEPAESITIPCPSQSPAAAPGPSSPPCWPPVGTQQTSPWQDSSCVLHLSSAGLVGLQPPASQQLCSEAADLDGVLGPSIPSRVLPGGLVGRDAGGPEPQQQSRVGGLRLPSGGQRCCLRVRGTVRG